MSCQDDSLTAAFEGRAHKHPADVTRARTLLGINNSLKNKRIIVPLHPQCGAVPPGGLQVVLPGVMCPLRRVLPPCCPLAVLFCQRCWPPPWSPSEGLLATRWPLNELVLSSTCLGFFSPFLFFPLAVTPCSWQIVRHEVTARPVNAPQAPFFVFKHFKLLLLH